MLDERLIDILIERIVNRIEEGNSYILGKIGESIKNIGALSPSKAQQLVQILKYGGNYDKIVEKLAEITKLNVAEIYQIFEEVAKSDYLFAKQFYDYKCVKYIPYEENLALQNQVKALANITANEFVNFSDTRLLGFGWQDEKGNVTFKGLKDTYEQVIDEAILTVSQGKDTFDNQMYKTIKQLGGGGLKIISPKTYITKDKDGNIIEKHYTNRLDSAVRMNLKGALRNLHNETQAIFGEEFGSDGVEISVHENPALDHAEVQGRQFSKEEFKKFQNDQDAVDYTGKLFTKKHDGKDRRSISEYNCYHYTFDIVLGVSKPNYSNEELQEILDNNDKGFELDGAHYTNYEGTQLQRKLETEIRKQKDIQIMAKASGNKELVQESQQKITQLTHKYKQLSDVSGLPTKMERMRVSGYRRTSVAKIETKNNIIFNNSLNKITDVKLLNRNKQQIINLTNKFPKMQLYLSENELSVGSAELTEIANTTSFDKYSKNHITLNYKKYNDKDFAKNEWANEGLFNAKFLKENADVYTTTHEYGHIVLNKLYKDELKNKEMLDFYNKTSKFNFENTITKKYNLEIQEIARKLENKPRLEIKDYISGYGKRNELEMFAEMFAESQLGKDTIISKAMQEFLKKYLK